MDKKSIIWIIAIAVLIGVLALVVSRNGRDEKYDWSRKLRFDKTMVEPYDLGFFHELMKQKTSGKFTEIGVRDKFNEHKSELLKNPKEYTYFFAGTNCYFDEEHYQFITEFVRNGGTAFLSSNTIPDTLLEIFGVYYPNFTNTYVDSHTNVVFSNKSLSKTHFNFDFRIKNHISGAQVKYWQMDASSWNNKDVVSVSGLEHYKNADFIRINYGAGSLYLHFNPIFLSNIFFVQENKNAYFENLLAHMQLKNVCLDKTLRIFRINENIFDMDERKTFSDFLLKHKSLKVAWYILIFGILSFLFFAGRRKQKEIPVLEKPQNKTFRFLETISNFYWKAGNSDHIYQRECNQFIQYVKENLKLRIEDDKHLPVDLIVEKSGVSREVIVAISSIFAEKGYFNVGGGNLAELCKWTGRFYEEHKKYHGKHK